ncbi:uncharacterized protein [Polyergus mexicanus]|uniref:uncharacterized protein n=1 Tax=Polyergus mexicanus TaxID=615972 RepID=UPI0038B59F51
MKSRVYWLFVICYVTCILYRNALGVSTSVKVFTSINNASRSEKDAGILKSENTRNVQSIETKTRLDGITLENGWSKFDIPLESPKDLSEMIKFPSDFLKERCSRYCIQQVKTGENDSIVKEFNTEKDSNKILDEGIEKTKETNINKKIQEFINLRKRSAEIMDENKTNNDDETMDFSDVLLPSVETTVARNFINYSVFSLRARNNSLTSYGDIKIPKDALKNSKAFNGKILVLEQQQKAQSRSSEIASLNEDIDTNDVKLSTRDNVLMQIHTQDSDQDFSTKFARNIGNSFERRKILLEINAKSNLIAAPGTTHRVLFDVTNNCVLPVRYAIRARSLPFRIFSIMPTFLWLYPGQTTNVAVDIVVPLDTQDTVNTLTLSIDGTEIPEKTVYVYVQNAISKSIDNVKPIVDYTFNSNCAGKLDKDRCEKTFWSVDINVQDSDSGLKRVISTPNGLYLRTKFISGTKDRVTFFYSSTCCSTTATITAIDVSDNEYSRSIDVTAWDNLSQGEIAAIVLGALLLLFLIILLIIAIIYCVSRRSSHDLPYTQRYGSRPPVRSERTSF